MKDLGPATDKAVPRQSTLVGEDGSQPDGMSTWKDRGLLGWDLQICAGYNGRRQSYRKL